MRSVVLSNSMVVATVGQADGSIPSVVVVRDQLHEIIELVPSIPRLHKLDTLLRGMEYDERSEDADELYADDPAVSRVSFLLALLSEYFIFLFRNTHTKKQGRRCRQATSN